jgi:prepilin peptidase CpaA
MSVLSPIILAVFPAGLIAAALEDATSFTIPNRIPAVIAAAFLPAALIAHLPVEALDLHLAVGAAAFALGVVLFALRWCGGGDAKLMAAAVLWLGLPALVGFMFWTCVAGGVLALGLILIRQGVLAPYAARGPVWLGRLIAESSLPYGLAIAFGALMALPQSTLAVALLPALAGG